MFACGSSKNFSKVFTGAMGTWFLRVAFRNAADVIGRCRRQFVMELPDVLEPDLPALRNEGVQQIGRFSAAQMPRN